MLNILLSGACGRMGKMVAACAESDENTKIIAGVDIFGGNADFPIYKSFSEVKEKADVIIDFSSADALDSILDYCEKTGTPAVLCATGYKESQLNKIRTVSEKCAMFRSSNMSLGVNLLCGLVKKAALILGTDFDIEIIEKHHNQKLDAPSGTAIMLADSINTVFDDKMNYEYDRHTKRAKRTKNEIGLHAVRGGTIVGEHDVIFAGPDEVITLSHSAQSREIFARGALLAGKFMKDKKNGMYNMNDVFDF